MILTDTSVWIDHFRGRETGLAELLLEGMITLHPLVTEELACGNLTPREEVLNLLETLPKAPQVSHAEFLDFVQGNALVGKGLGVVDIHLLASARLSHSRIWSRDKSLCRAAHRLGVLEPRL